MITDLQKASMLKRISAAILDGILLVIAICGFALLLSAVLGYDGYNRQVDQAYAKYEAQFGVKFEISAEEYAAMTEAERSLYQKAYEALTADQDAMHAYSMVLTLTMLIATVSILLSYVLLELVIPLILGNGQTVGKKVFSLAVIRVDGVKLPPMQLFIRTILGKYTLETMIPVYIVIMLMFNLIGLLGTLILGAIALLQVILLAATKTRSAIHDKLAGTVVVDMTSQMIFRTSEDLLAYQKRIHEEEVARKPY